MRLDIDVSDVLDQCDVAEDQLRREMPRMLVAAVKQQASLEKKTHAFDNYTTRLEKSIMADNAKRSASSVSVDLVAGSKSDDIRGDGGSARYASIVERRGRMRMADRKAYADQTIQRELEKQAALIARS